MRHGSESATKNIYLAKRATVFGSKWMKMIGTVFLMFIYVMQEEKVYLFYGTCVNKYRQQP
jgi:hypothetical protein